MINVKIYTTPTCPWCIKAKEFLRSKKIKYTEINVVGNLKAQQEMIQKSHQMGVPVVDVIGTIIVGFDPEAILKAVTLKNKVKIKKKVKGVKNKVNKRVKKRNR